MEFQRNFRTFDSNIPHFLQGSIYLYFYILNFKLILNEFLLVGCIPPKNNCYPITKYAKNSFDVLPFSIFTMNTKMF